MQRIYSNPKSTRCGDSRLSVVFSRFGVFSRPSVFRSFPDT